MLYANTDDGSSALWVCDGNGVVVDNISFSIGERAPILEQINEHYGTSFAGWSDNEISLRVGDTVPNWNAYEKITMPIYLALLNGQTTYFCGKLQNNVFELYGPEDDKMFVISDTIIRAASNGANRYLSDVAIPKLTSLGYEINSYNIGSNGYEVGDEIADWDNYVEIT